MNGAGCSELLEVCTASTTMPDRLDREPFHSTRVADDTFCLRLGHGFGVVFLDGGDSQVSGRYRIGGAKQGDGPTTGGRPQQTSVLRSKLGGNAPITCHCSVSKKLHTQGACDRHLLRVQGVRLQIVCHNGGESPWRQRLHEVDRWPSLGSNAGAVSGSRALVGALGLRVVMEKIAHNLAKSGS